MEKLTNIKDKETGQQQMQLHVQVIQQKYFCIAETLTGMLSSLSILACVYLYFYFNYIWYIYIYIYIYRLLLVCYLCDCIYYQAAGMRSGDILFWKRLNCSSGTVEFSCRFLFKTIGVHLKIDDKIAVIWKLSGSYFIQLNCCKITMHFWRIESWAIIGERSGY